MVSSLTLTGILYPPALKANSSNAKLLGNKCEEFTDEELDSLTRDLIDLPVWVEHDSAQLVGSVKSARRTHSDAVEVKAVVNASSEAGRNAIRMILDKKMVGLSLSHSYDLSCRPGSATAQKINIAMNDGGEWQNVMGDLPDHKVKKQLRELSVCVEPARSGCHIHNVVSASVLANTNPHPNTKQQIKFGINTDVKQTSHEDDNITIVGLFNCSAMEAIPQADTTPSSEQNPNPNQQNMSQPRGADGRFVSSQPSQGTQQQVGDAPPTNNVPPTNNAQQTANTQQHVESNVTQPTTSPNEETMKQNGTNNNATSNGNNIGNGIGNSDKIEKAIGEVQAKHDALSPITNKLELEQETADILKNSGELVKMMKSEMDILKARQQEMELQFKEETERNRKAHEEEKKKQEEEINKHRERAHRLEEEQKAAYAKELEKAAALKQQNFQMLQETLKSINPAAVTTTNKGNLNEQQRLQQEAEVAKVAINALSQFQNKVETKQMENQSLKRQHQDMSHALAPFGGAGVVNASKELAAASEPEPKRQQLKAPNSGYQEGGYSKPDGTQRQISEIMTQFRADNPKALWTECDSLFRKHMHSSSMHGVVNASNGSTSKPWSRQELANPADQPALNAMHLQPELFDMICSMNTGRTPTPEETSAIMKAVNVQRDTRYT